jgi:hypothetical protein
MNSSVKFAVTLNILVLLSILFTNSASGQNGTQPEGATPTPGETPPTPTPGETPPTPTPGETPPTPTPGETPPTPSEGGTIEHVSSPQSFTSDYDTIIFVVIAAIVVAIIGIGLHKVKSHRSKKHVEDSVEVLMRGGIGK